MRTIAIVVAGLFASTASIALAQDNAPQAAADSASGDIVVTAQKRSERLVDVPIAITALTASKLSDNGITSTQALAQVVPGLRLDLAGATSQPTIRGVGSALAGPGVGSAVATYIDGIYQPNPIANNFELSDIESIDVLKGPQGTLFGRNATGGAIAITTSKPTFDMHAKGTVSYGRYNDMRATASVSGGITDKIAASITGLVHANDGFMKDVDTGRDVAKTDSYAVRGKLLIKPTERLEILLTAMHLYNHDDNVVTYNAYNGYSNARLYPGLYPNPVVPSARGQISIDSPNRFFVKQSSFTARVDLDLDFANLISYTGWQRTDSEQDLDFDASKVPYQNAQFPSYGRAFSQEVNLVSKPGGRLSWVVGGYYFRDSSGQENYSANGLSVVGVPAGATTLTADPFMTVSIFDTSVKTRAFAGFADATYEVVDKLFLTLGGRYSREISDRRFVFHPNFVFPGHGSFNSFTPRAVLRWNFDSHSNVYASYSKGFKAGGFNSTGTTPDPFKPEKIDAYELGFKTSRPGLRISASGYYYKYKDLQVASYILGAAVVNNAANSEIYGGDLDVSFDVTPRLTFDFSGAYTHARYKRFDNAPDYPGTGVYIPNPDPSLPPLVNDPVRTQAVTLIDAKMQRSPEWTGTASVTYTAPIGENSLRFYASYYHTSSFNLDPPGRFVQKPYGLLNARVTFALPDNKISLSVYGNNLTDSSYLSQLLLLASAPLQQWGFPRTYGVELGYKF